MNPYTKRQYEQIIQDLQKQRDNAQHEKFQYQQLAFWIKTKRTFRAITLIGIGFIIGYLINQFT
jgi:hypothetical protein